MFHFRSNTGIITVSALITVKSIPYHFLAQKHLLPHLTKKNVYIDDCHTIKWSIDSGERFSSDEQNDDGDDDNVDGAGEESIGSLEDNG